MKKILMVYLTISAFLLSCKKSVFLDAIPDQALVVPVSLQDYQAILDNDNIMNGSSRLDGLTPGFEEVGTDDYYALPDISSLDIAYINLYSWNNNVSSGKFNDWNFGYRCAFYANEVLDGLSKMDESKAQQAQYNQLKGSALFYRSHIFYHLAQVFAPVYDSASARADWGIPLQTSSDINAPVKRATLYDTYQRILLDLQTALPLLPTQPLYKTRPSKPAVYGLIAKVYLSMSDYNNALLYADSCLQLQKTLLDYNEVYNKSNSATYPFDRFNNDVIFHSVMDQLTMTGIGLCRVDSTLYNSYDGKDIRKKIFFTNRGDSWSFRGSYDHSSRSFTGITTDEMYLIRAEGYARQGKVREALGDLNTLLKTRWFNGQFKDISAISAEEALQVILAERRKELVFRGTRFTDLRRLNKEGAGITLTRVIGNQVFTLAPNSLFYTFLIPAGIISFNPGMPQNPR